MHTGVDGDLVDIHGYHALSIDFDDLQLMSLNREAVVGIARERDEAEAVLLSLFDVDNGECDILRASARAPSSVDESRVRQCG